MYLSHFKWNNNIMCKQIAMRWLFCNKVNTVMLITLDLLVKKYNKKWRDRDIWENEEKEKGSEMKVQFKREPLIIFHGPD